MDVTRDRRSVLVELWIAMPHVLGSTPGVGTVFKSRCWVAINTEDGIGGFGLQRASDAARPLRISRAQSTAPKGVL